MATEPKNNLTVTGFHIGDAGRLDGSRDKVLAAVQTAAIPEHWRAAIVAEITARPAAHNWITVFCHATESKITGGSKTVLDLDVESSAENI